MWKIWTDMETARNRPALTALTGICGSTETRGKVDSDDMGGEVFSVRRVSDYLSSHIDLDDCIRTDMGCTQRDDGPNEVKNHHAPLTPRSTQSTGLFERAVYSRKFQTLSL